MTTTNHADCHSGTFHIHRDIFGTLYLAPCKNYTFGGFVGTIAAFRRFLASSIFNR